MNLREVIENKFRGGREQANIRIDITSFGYPARVPPDSDLGVRTSASLPNPQLHSRIQKKLTGRHPRVRALHPIFPANSGVH